MKKIKNSAAAMILAICVTGCLPGKITGGTPEPKITAGYTCEITAAAAITPPDKENEEQFSFTGNLKRLGTGYYEMEITSPETIAGLKITMTEDRITSSLNGMTLDGAAAEMPSPSPVMCIFRTLDDAAVKLTGGEQLTPGSDPENWCLTQENYTIIFDSSGVPLTAASVSPQITIEFSSFTSIDLTIGES